ncbi:MAG: hypothetical protein AB7W59_24300 [Acidimicrobiia bacterium]
MGIDEFVDLDIEEFQRRANERLLNLIERNRPTIEADLGATFDAVEQQGRIELRVADPELPAGRPVYVATTTAAGRLLLTDVSGRYDGRL